jgi:hypothetical protein
MCISLPLNCDSIATSLGFLIGALLKGEFRGWLIASYGLEGPVMSNAVLKSNQTTAATGARTKVLAANDVRSLIANNLRSLICRCLVTHQPVDLHFYADYATLARIGSNDNLLKVHA